MSLIYSLQNTISKLYVSVMVLTSVLKKKKKKHNFFYIIEEFKTKL